MSQAKAETSAHFYQSFNQEKQLGLERDFLVDLWLQPEVIVSEILKRDRYGQMTEFKFVSPGLCYERYRQLGQPVNCPPVLGCEVDYRFKQAEMRHRQRDRLSYQVVDESLQSGFFVLKPISRQDGFVDFLVSTTPEQVLERRLWWAQAGFNPNWIDERFTWLQQTYPLCQKH